MTFLTAAGDIVPRAYTGTCATHQRRVAKTIKRATTMGLFSAKRGGFNSISPFHEPVDPAQLATTKGYEELVEVGAEDSLF